MDENATTSSSAAAVADSASAAASIKITTPPPATSDSTSVKLLIKASNQQFEDQIIESDLLWTVKRLKIQISLVYPSKPAVGEQKLIYSGQLLADALILKDVLRSYKDVYTYNHIFHLVYTPKNITMPPKVVQKPKATSASMSSSSSPLSLRGTNGSNNAINTATSDGLRQRFVGANNTPQQHQQQSWFASFTQPQQPQQQFIPNTMNSTTYNAASAQCSQVLHPNGQFNMQNMATQAAMYNWMQQVYSQYMDQYMRLSTNWQMTTQNASDGATPVITGSASLSPNPFLQQLPFYAPASAPQVAAVIPNVANSVMQPPVIPMLPSATQQQEDVSTQAQAPLQRETIAVNHQQQQQQEHQQQQQLQQQIDAPRFPNIVQEEQENRDWLDSFFSITRFALFLTVLYFNSSPLRCLLVFIIAGGIYLYHIGVIRLRRERNNNNINRDNNAAAAAAAAAAAVDQIRQGVEQRVEPAQTVRRQQEEQQPHENAGNVVDDDINNANDEPTAAAAAAADGANPEQHSFNTDRNSITDSSANGSSNENDAADNNATSVISFLRTFVVTFFTSLLPETPAL